MIRLLRISMAFVFLLTVWRVSAQDHTLTIDLDRTGAVVSPTLHGIFFEEISHGGEGGLYAELIQNRGFEESRIPPGCTLDTGWLTPPPTPHFQSGKVSDWKMKFEPTSAWPAWSLKTSGNSRGVLSIDKTIPLTPATPQSLRLEIESVSKSDPVAVVNEGFWGIRVDKDELYELSFYLRSDDYRGEITASLFRDEVVAATCWFKKEKGNGWTKYSGVLKANADVRQAKFQLSFSGKGTVWLDFVSLFPVRTFKNRPNGMRADLANYLAELKPSFVRWPGGCFVEGISAESAPNWKTSLGKLEDRAGTYSPWGYWSSDGIGYHEFLQFCEDIHADAMYVFNCGIACEMRSGVYQSDEKVPRLIADILDGIEYAIGSVDSKWGAVRAKNGHPEPFRLKYVEVGNEQVGERYGKRFNLFYDAIKKKYPQLEVMAAMGIAHLSKPTIQAIRKMDIADEHAYKGIYWPMINADWYDRYERGDFKLYVGEYACNSGVGNGNMMAALNDAVYIQGMERNSDLIKMSSYAPLLENVNDTDWPVNLIRFNHEKSFARISYYAIKMMNENKATVNLPTLLELKSKSDTTPHYSGKIGLSTWDTQAEFKNVEIVEDGKIIYQSDFLNRADEWQTEGGQWKTDRGVLAQTADGAWPMAILNKKLNTYTLRLQARRTGGPNAFMIPLAIRDSKNYLRVHIGAWWNRVCAFELVSDGQDAMVTQPVKLEQPLEINRWYAVEVRVMSNQVVCYLDGKLLMTYHEPKRLFSIAGRDEKTGEVVVKVVNASAEEAHTKIQFASAGLTGSWGGHAIELFAGQPTDENSFDSPMKFVPKEKTIAARPAGDFRYAFKPWSISILRLAQK